MTDRRRAAALLLAAAMLIIGAFTHEAIGWKFVREFAGPQPSNPGLTAAVGAGWQLGSVSLFAFGLLALVAGVARWRRQPVAPAAPRIVAGAVVCYGSGALLLGNRNFLFIYFGYLVIGALLAFGSARASG